MIRFDSDYVQSAHGRILARLSETGGEQNPGYGEDAHCRRAAELIRGACGAPGADVHFLVGGTQTNATLISAILRPHQGVISAETGHIAVHETGAVEATGHKVLTLPSPDGKLRAEDIEHLYRAHWRDAAHEHTVQPAMVYISHPTESGTVYTRRELEAVSAVCRRLNLPLMLDGARLGYGLAAEGADLSLPEIAALCDVFYIGGTKVGALFGEAVVITDDRLKPDFRYHIKQRGGMLAKGWLLGLQFETLFEDGLYLDLGRHGVEQALRVRDCLRERGIPLQYETGTNQQFPRLPDGAVKALEEKYAFTLWEKPDDSHSVIRICTSWGTDPAHVDALLADLRQL